MILVGYSIRDSVKLKEHEVTYLKNLGFGWKPHRSGQEEGDAPPDPPDARMAMMMKKAEAPTGGQGTPKKEVRGSMNVAVHDLEIAIQNLEDRAVRLRDLLEEEEIMAEQSKRLGDAAREELGDTRDYVVKYLEEVHRQLMQFQGLRDGIFLRAARQTTAEGDNVDYEAMPNELESDLDVIHTVPLDQVKAVLDK